jgi:hypothetical protein
LSKQPPITLRVWGPWEAIGYLRQYSNFTRHVQCSGEVRVQVLGEKRILLSEYSILFSYFPLSFLSLTAIVAAGIAPFSMCSFIRSFSHF